MKPYRHQHSIHWIEFVLLAVVIIIFGWAAKIAVNDPAPAMAQIVQDENCQ